MASSARTTCSSCTRVLQFQECVHDCSRARCRHAHGVGHLVGKNAEQKNGRVPSVRLAARSSELWTFHDSSRVCFWGARLYVFEQLGSGEELCGSIFFPVEPSRFPPSSSSVATRRGMPPTPTRYLANMGITMLFFRDFRADNNSGLSLFLQRWTFSHFERGHRWFDFPCPFTPSRLMGSR